MLLRAKGAAAALARLECEEALAHARLEQAMERGDRLEIDSLQTYWLRCSESLRKLDLSIEFSRRSEQEQVALQTAQQAVLFTAEWMRIAIAQFLSAETGSLMAIRNPGEFRAYFIKRFRGVLWLTVKSADKTRSAVPCWAKREIETAWNVVE